MLSVIVPVYNGIKYLEDTVKSLQNSKCDDMEIILIDDGSTDGSSDLCDSLSTESIGVKCIHTSNNGIASARNKGVWLAQGEYICFCDQDDIVVPGVYERIISKMRQNNAELGICSTGRIIDGKKSSYECLCDNCYSGNEIKEYLLYPILFLGFNYDFVKSDNYLYGTLWKCVFRKKFFINNNITFRRYINYEDDMLAVTQALSCADKVVTISDIGYYWRINTTSESHISKFNCDIFEQFNMLDEDMISFLEKSGIEKDILEKYIDVAMCSHYIDAYKNYNGLKGKSRQIKKSYIKELKKYLKSTDYRKRLICTKKLKKMAIRKSIMFFALRIGAVRIAIILNKLVDMLENNLAKSQWLVKCERKLKRS